jgi:hypothetical protein
MDRRPQGTNPERTPAGEDVPPWERPGAVRRDCEPDRGSLLWWLAKASLLLAVLSVYTCLPGFVGFPLGVATYLMARRDLAMMLAGTMDPQGETTTLRAKEDSILAVVLCLVSLLLASFFLTTGWGDLLRVIVRDIVAPQSDTPFLP